MAEQTTASASPFPLPPPFYNNFTPANRKQLQQLQSSNTSTLDPLSLPTELRYLLPPAPPTTGRYRTFGTEIDHHAATPTLADAGIEQLFPTPNDNEPLNPQPHLIALSRSLLATFLALSGTLAQDPTQFEPHTREMQTLVFNLHDLINRYRPHQARETLILDLEERIAKRREETRAIREVGEKVRTLLEGLKDAGIGERTVGVDMSGSRGIKDVNSSAKVADEKRVARQKALWVRLEAMKVAQGDDKVNEKQSEGEPEAMPT
ncbi:Hypothetical protein R9X50_00548500 [Acrodontium crateriforme]|uniref:Mediator of RNA polymerase II transcription subunit 7 n=1 Tax=Acrodontium crateriforme TaxID=150365 RepID=A0AAQ3M789_9PEZI|nr:Hypothetical protein R9X50_00548500 [Acrodontium crateriforme]